MKIPNLRLMRMYGNEEVFFQKTAAPFDNRHEILAAVREEMDRIEQLRVMNQHLLAQRINAQSRLQELAKYEQTISNAHHTRAPQMVGDMASLYGRGSEDMPIGMTEGMVRMASAIGQDMAKTAGDPYREPSPTPAAGTTAATTAAEKGSDIGDDIKAFAKKTGLTGKTLGMRNWILKPALLAGAGLATYGGLKAFQGGLKWLGNEGRPATYNAGGNQLAPDVNEYGQPQYRLRPTFY